MDYFVEILIFYGLLGALSVYELRKSIVAGQLQKAHLEEIERTGKQALKEAAEVRMQLQALRGEVRELRERLKDASEK